MTLIRRWFHGVAAALVVLSLAGCGGGGSSGGGASAGMADDDFIAQVRALVALDADSPDVLPYDAITITTPEQSEPVEI